MAAKKTTEHQARVWLNTVLAPLTRRLGDEERRAASGRWSFDHRRDFFESLCFVSQMVQPSFEPNLRQFLKRFPEFSKASKSHDIALTVLLEGCRGAFQALMAAPQFTTMLNDVPTADRTYFAEYVVNAMPELSASFFSTASVWNSHRSALLGLREAPAVKPAFDELNKRGDAFLRVVRKLNSSVEKKAEALADEFGLPAVDPGFVDGP